MVYGRAFIQHLKKVQENIGVLSITPWETEPTTKNLTGTQLADILSTISERFRLVEYDWKKTLVACYGENEDGTQYYFDDDSLDITHYSKDGEQAWLNFLEDLRLWDMPLPSNMKYGWYEATTEEVDDDDFLNDWYYTVKLGILSFNEGYHQREGVHALSMFNFLDILQVSCYPDSSIPLPNLDYTVEFYDRRDLELRIYDSWGGDGITVQVKYNRADDDDFNQHSRVILTFSFMSTPMGTLNYPPHMLTEYEEVQRTWFS